MVEEIYDNFATVLVKSDGSYRWQSFACRAAGEAHLRMAASSGKFTRGVLVGFRPDGSAEELKSFGTMPMALAAAC